MPFEFTNTLPADLENVALVTFDKLVRKGEIHYSLPKVEIIQIDGLQYHFSTTSAFRLKPVLASDAPGRSKPVGPFVDPPEDFIIARIGESHKLILNKYCVYRPMLILHTALFALQTDDLDESDLAAAWAILHRMKTPQMIIYNCGVEAGSSQGHKHIQIFPKQDSEDFRPFPSKALSTEDITDNIEGVPFKHFVIRLPTGASSDYVFQQYERLLDATKSALREANAGGDYNLVLVREWLALIPRRRKGYGKDFIANAASMVGMMWMTSEEQRDKLLKLGLPGLSVALGIPARKGASLAPGCK